MPENYLSDPLLIKLADRIIHIVRKKDSLGHGQEQTRFAVISCISRTFKKNAANELNNGSAQIAFPPSYTYQDFIDEMVEQLIEQCERDALNEFP